MGRTTGTRSGKDAWKRHVAPDTLDWLLEPDNPSVRCLALTELLGKARSCKDVKDARHGIMADGPVPKILAQQDGRGYWGTDKDFYTSKYKGTVWQLLVLAELGADGRDEAVRNACEFVLAHSQDKESGGFAVHGSARNGGRHGEVIPCLTGNLLWALLKLGYGKDERVRRAVEWITTYQRFDDKDGSAPSGWPYDRFEICWGRHTCHMGVVKTLKALAQIPAVERTKEVRRTIERAAEYLLNHHIHKKSHDLTAVSKPGWLKFSFPLMYQTDVLEILLILTGLGYKDARMREAVDAVIGKRGADGRWTLEKSMNGKMRVNIERKGKPSKWITLNALRVLKAYGG